MDIHFLNIEGLAALNFVNIYKYREREIFVSGIQGAYKMLLYSFKIVFKLLNLRMKRKENDKEYQRTEEK